MVRREVDPWSTLRDHELRPTHDKDAAMRTTTITFEYNVKVPEKNSPQYDEIMGHWQTYHQEDYLASLECLSNADNPQERQWMLEDNMAYQMLECYHKE